MHFKKLTSLFPNSRTTCFPSVTIFLTLSSPVGNKMQVEVMDAGNRKWRRGLMVKGTAKQNPRKTWIDFISANCMGILQLPYQRTYYNGVLLSDFIVQ